MYVAKDNEITNQDELRMATLYYMTMNNLNHDERLYKHHGKRGRFYLTRLDGSSHPEVHTSTDLFSLIEQAKARPFNNWFVTQNTIRTNRRPRIRYKKDDTPYNNTRNILAFYLDFDVKRSGVVGMDAFRKTLPDILKSCDVEPTAVIKSGHGYHAVILLASAVPVNSFKVSNLWEMIEESLITKVSKACFERYGKAIVDSAVSDITRILRIIGTYNVKDAEHPVPVTINYLNLNHRPSLREMQQKWAPHYHKGNKNHHRSDQQRNNKHKHHATGKNAGTLYSARRHDIFKVVKMRKNEAKYSNNPVFIKHFREFALFYYVTSAVMALNERTIALNVKSLDRQFCVPLPDCEVEHVISEIGYIKDQVELAQSMMTEYRYHKQYKKLGAFPKGYVPTNELIIKRLHITPKEQLNLTTLIDVHEKQRRLSKRLLQRKFKRQALRAERNRHKKISHDKLETKKLYQSYRASQMTNERNFKIIELRGQGLSLRTIAKKVNIGKTTVSKVIKQGVHLNPKNTYLTSACGTISAWQSRYNNSLVSKYKRKQLLNKMIGTVNQYDGIIYNHVNGILTNKLNYNRIRSGH